MGDRTLVFSAVYSRQETCSLKCFNSLTFSNGFILVRVMMDVEPENTGHKMGIHLGWDSCTEVKKFITEIKMFFNFLSA